MQSTIVEMSQQSITLFDAIDDFIYVADPESFEIIFANQKFIEGYGDGLDVIGRKCYEVVANRSTPCSNCLSFKRDQPLVDPTHVWEYFHDETERWYRCKEKLIKWTNGEIVRFNLSTDITPEKTSQIRLADSEERYKLATAASDQGIWDWYTNSQNVYYSDHWKAQLGYRPDELPHNFSTWESLLHPDDKERMLKRVAEFLANPQEYFIEEFRLRHRDGSYRWIMNKAAAVTDENNRVLRMFGAHTDITEVKQMQEKLEQSEGYHRTVFNAVTDAIIISDFEGNIRNVNPKACEIYGYTRDEMLMLNAQSLVTQNDHGKLVEFLQRLHRGETWKTETIDRRKDGSLIYTEVNGTRFRLNGHYSVMAVIRDITKRKLIENELVAAMKQAESANIHKNNFLANMSHEIRTPMNSILGFSDLLRGDELDGEAKNRYINIIESNSQQLLNLIDDIIDVAKIEAGEIKMNIESCELVGLMKDLVVMFNQVKLDKKKAHLRIKAEIPENCERKGFETDAIRLKQVLINLLTNAIKFSDKGTVRFGFETRDHDVLFFVQDEGIGIAEQDQQAIFERFQQASDQTAARYGGTGLGLSISKGIVTLLGGQIWVESKLGVGSKFCFVLPGFE